MLLGAWQRPYSTGAVHACHTPRLSQSGLGLPGRGTPTLRCQPPPASPQLPRLRAIPSPKIAAQIEDVSPAVSAAAQEVASRYVGRTKDRETLLARLSELGATLLSVFDGRRSATYQRQVSLKLESAELQVLEALLDLSPQEYVSLLDRHVDLPGAFAMGTLRKLASEYVQDPCIPSATLSQKTTTPSTPHIPAVVKRWLNTRQEAKALIRMLAEDAVGIYTEPLARRKVADQAQTVQYLQGTFFEVCNAVLGSEDIHTYVRKGELASVIPITGSPDRIAVDMGKGFQKPEALTPLEGKLKSSRPFLSGFQLGDCWHLVPLEDKKRYKSEKYMKRECDPTRSCLQIMQVCGEMHQDNLEYAILFTDECFWLMHYERDDSITEDGPSGTLFISECISISDPEQMPVATACMLVNKAKQDKLAARQAKAAQTAGSGAAADSMEASFIQGDKWQPLLDSHLPGVDAVWYGYMMGEGTTGSVYLGELGQGKEGTGDRVAVKQALLRWPAKAARASLPTERLCRELALLQGRLSHLQGSVVPQLHGHGFTKQGQQPFYVMEVLSELPDDAVLSLEVRRNLVDGLAAIHAAGVHHGDLQSHALMAARDGSIRITDFSAARVGASEAEFAMEMQMLASMLGVAPVLPKPQL